MRSILYVPTDHLVLQCSDTVGWAMQPVKSSLKWPGWDVITHSRRKGRLDSGTSCSGCIFCSCEFCCFWAFSMFCSCLHQFGL